MVGVMVERVRRKVRAAVVVWVWRLGSCIGVLDTFEGRRGILRYCEYFLDGLGLLRRETTHYAWDSARGRPLLLRYSDEC